MTDGITFIHKKNGKKLLIINLLTLSILTVSFRPLPLLAQNEKTLVAPLKDQSLVVVSKNENRDTPISPLVVDTETDLINVSDTNTSFEPIKEGEEPTDEVIDKISDFMTPILKMQSYIKGLLSLDKETGTLALGVFLVSSYIFYYHHIWPHYSMMKRQKELEKNILPQYERIKLEAHELEEQEKTLEELKQEVAELRNSKILLIGDDKHIRSEKINELNEKIEKIEKNIKLKGPKIEEDFHRVERYKAEILEKLPPAMNIQSGLVISNKIADGCASMLDAIRTNRRKLLAESKLKFGIPVSIMVGTTATYSLLRFLNPASKDFLTTVKEKQEIKKIKALNNNASLFSTIALTNELSRLRNEIDLKKKKNIPLSESEEKMFFLYTVINAKLKNPTLIKNLENSILKNTNPETLLKSDFYQNINKIKNGQDINFLIDKSLTQSTVSIETSPVMINFIDIFIDAIITKDEDDPDLKKGLTYFYSNFFYNLAPTLCLKEEDFPVDIAVIQDFVQKTYKAYKDEVENINKLKRQQKTDGKLQALETPSLPPTSDPSAIVPIAPAPIKSPQPKTELTAGGISN